MKNETEISFEVRKNPKREAIVKYYKNGHKRIIVQVTQEEMDKMIIGKLKEIL